MHIELVRSSSFNTFESWCQQKYFLSYCLALPDQGNKKADMGTIVHKALELLAKKQLAKKQNKIVVEDDEFGTFPCEEINPLKALNLAYDFLTKKFSYHVWEPEDFEFCRKSIAKLLELNNGIFNPENQNILACEQFFDFTLDYSWADGIRVKGTMDLLVSDTPDLIELVDYKTGKRYKELEEFKDDFQLRLYAYSIFKCFSLCQHVITTIIYMNAGGAFSIPFSREDNEQTEEMIREHIDRVRETKIPQKTTEWWKCKICHYNTKQSNGKSVCNQVHNEVVKLGIDKVIKKRQQKQTYTGGGKTRE